MDDKKRVLGRGLETLIPAARAAVPMAAPPPPAVAPPPPAGDAVRQVALEEIEPNPYQTRSRVDEQGLEEMAASIRAHGVLQPIVLRYKSPAPESGPRYQLIAGERRWLASQRAGRATVPAIVRQVSNQQAMELTIIENLQREDLNPMEQAQAFDRLGREFGLTQEQIAQKTGKDRSSIANYLRLLRLPPEVQALIGKAELSFGHAKALLALEAPESVIRLANKIVAEALSVRAAEALVQQMLHPVPKPEKPPRVLDPNVKEMERELERVLGVKVQIQDHKGKGKILIEYHSLEDFDRVLDQLGANK